MALGRERLKRPTVVALGLALAGMVAVVAGQLDPSAGIEFNGLGVALALGAAVSQAVLVTISRDGYRSVPTDQAMTVILMDDRRMRAADRHRDRQCGDARLPAGGAVGSAAGVVHRRDRCGHPSLAFLTGIRLIGGLRAGILMLIEPVVGVLLAALLLDERLQPIQLFGGAAILAAAMILQRSAGDEPEMEPAATPTFVDGRPARLPGAS